jgi:hypothetical protein
MKYGQIRRQGATFEVIKVTGDVVWIRDLDRGRSITNDAERVCDELAIEYGNRRIIYRDTDGEWDEFVHEHGRFLSFAPARGMAP